MTQLKSLIRSMSAVLFLPMMIPIILMCVLSSRKDEDDWLVFKYNIKQFSSTETRQQLVDRLIRDLHPHSVVHTKNTIQIIVDSTFNRYNRNGTKVAARVANIGAINDWTIMPNVVFTTSKYKYITPSMSVTTLRSHRK